MNNGSRGSVSFRVGQILPSDFSPEVVKRLEVVFGELPFPSSVDLSDTEHSVDVECSPESEVVNFSFV